MDHIHCIHERHHCEIPGLNQEIKNLKAELTVVRHELENIKLVIKALYDCCKENVCERCINRIHFCLFESDFISKRGACF